MKTGFLQFAVRQHDYTANLTYIRDHLQGANFDLLVLPELLTSGYLFENRDQLMAFAKKHTLEQTVADLQSILQDQSHSGALIGTIPEVVDGRIYNTGIAVSRDGLLGKQRKRHLTRLEKDYFDPGNTIAVFDIKGIKTGIVTCFDAWFPELFRLLVRRGVQVICQPANFGGPWTLDIMRVRAMENRVFCIVANRTGREEAGGIVAEFRGESQIIDSNGEILIRAEKEGQLSLVDIAPSKALNKGNVMCDDLAAEWSRYEVEERIENPED